jgi:hypothetical protein
MVLENFGVLGGMARFATAVFTLLRDHWGREARILRVQATPFSDPKLLKAYSLTFTNGSDENLHLESLWIKSPKHAPLVHRWHIPIIILDGTSAAEPWESTESVALNVDLAPGKSFHHEIGIPAGFGITASRRAPVVISIAFTSHGLKERRRTRDLVRFIG